MDTTSALVVGVAILNACGLFSAALADRGTGWRIGDVMRASAFLPSLFGRTHPAPRFDASSRARLSDHTMFHAHDGSGR